MKLVYDIKPDGDVAETIIIEYNDMNKIKNVKVMVYGDIVAWDSYYNVWEIKDNKMYFIPMINLVEVSLHSKYVVIEFFNEDNVVKPKVECIYHIIHNNDIRRELAKAKSNNEMGINKNPTWWIAKYNISYFVDNMKLNNISCGIFDKKKGLDESLNIEINKEILNV